MSTDIPQAEAVENIKYGELIVLGYNGHLISGDKGRRRSKYILWKRAKANGVKPSQRHLVTNPQSSKAVQDVSKHSVSYTLSRNKAIIVEYLRDDDTDMFQIGRSMEGPIDFVVIDTVPGHLRTQLDTAPQSTISRFACRIIVDRVPPYTARIYAAGFDAGKNIFLGEKAVKWCTDENVDGLTTNGVFVMQPQGGFSPAGKPGHWREVSVGGALFSLRDSRPSPLKNHQLVEEQNILRDGTLIDLCGATIVWRSAQGLIASPSEGEFQRMVSRLNAGRPQCPVGLNTLVLPTRGSLNLRDRQPYVYLPCGHVHGNHNWGQDDSNIRKCPLCLSFKRDHTIAILTAIEELTRDQRLDRGNVVFLIDSDDTLQTIENPQTSETSNTAQALETLSNMTNKMVMQWIPCHAGIKGNVIADQLAKEGTLLEQPESGITFPQQKP